MSLTYNVLMKTNSFKIIPTEYLSRPKFVLYDSHIEIYNYKSLLGLAEDRIELHEYIVLGNNMQIRVLNNDILVITGKINQVVRRSYEQE